MLRYLVRRGSQWSVRMCLHEISIGIGRMSRARCPPVLGGSHLIRWRTGKKTRNDKVAGNSSCLTMELGHLGFPALRRQLKH